jgi:hypothetical protein
MLATNELKLCIKRNTFGLVEWPNIITIYILMSFIRNFILPNKEINYSYTHKTCLTLHIVELSTKLIHFM